MKNYLEIEDAYKKVRIVPSGCDDRAYLIDSACRTTADAFNDVNVPIFGMTIAEQLIEEICAL